MTLHYDAQGRRYIGERIAVPAEVFATVQQELVRSGAIPADRAETLLLNELVWKYDRRAVAVA
ncbi:MAG TPA: hypothetical protein VKV26_19820 [Dehalococcoidia bacterium]|nr:hypothetical protein [Dehalococcoidia bacterium]